MIPLVGISQVDLVKDKDTMVCYTREENRKIALIMLDEERYRTLYSIADNITKELQNKIKVIETKASLVEDLVKNNQEMIAYQDSLIYDVDRKLKQEKKKNKRLKYIKAGSIILNGILIVLLFI
jgi:hypothetical protein